MFKDDYKKCNDSIKADPVLVENIIRQSKHKKAKSRRTFLQRAGSIAAAFLILISSITIVYNSVLRNEFVTEVKSYGEVYTLLKAMNQREFIAGLDNQEWLAKAPMQARGRRIRRRTRK